MFDQLLKIRFPPIHFDTIDSFNKLSGDLYSSIFHLIDIR